MTFTVNQPITYELVRPLTTAEAHVVNILLYKPTRAIFAMARPIEQRIAECNDPVIGSILEQWGVVRRINTPLA